MIVGSIAGLAAGGSSDQKAGLEQVRLDNVGQGVNLLLNRGGQRFDPGSPEHTLLQQWIRAGAPRDTPDAPRLIGLNVSPVDEVIEEPRAAVVPSEGQAARG